METATSLPSVATDFESKASANSAARGIFYPPFYPPIEKFRYHLGQREITQISRFT
jgi:hypothetical protein